MPDSSQNGHSSAPHPLVRPPQGERAARRLAGNEDVLPEEAPVLEADAETAVEAEVAEPLELPLSVEEFEAQSSQFSSPRETGAPDAGFDPFAPTESGALAPAGAGGNGGEPPFVGGDGEGGDNPFRDPNTPRDQELGLFEHLSELRSRILYCVVAVSLAMVLTWNKCLEISEWFAHPIKVALQGKGTLISTNPTGFFTIYLQVSLISALILTMPFLLLQVWRFIEPALTNNERKFSLVLVPFSSLLFFLGAAMGYLMTPMFFRFFLLFQPTGVLANWDYFESVMLMGKTLLIFGLAFQVPVITIFLNKTGIVSRNILIQYWRHAVVIIFTLVAFVVPTWDPLTMTACAVPPCLLYLLSIWIVKWL